MQTLIVHVANEDAVVCEVEKLPEENSQFLLVSNMRKRDGKDLHYLDEGVTSMMIPWHRINFVQVVPSEEAEEVIGFIRD